MGSGLGLGLRRLRAPGLELLDEHVELILDLRRGARRAELLTKLGERLLLQHGQLLAVPAQGEG